MDLVTGTITMIFAYATTPLYCLLKEVDAQENADHVK